MLDGESHGRWAELCENRAVDVLRKGMHDTLRMNDHFEAVRFQAEQPVGFDQLEAFVGHGRRIDGDLGAHRPVWVLGRFLGGDVCERVCGAVAELSAGCS